MRTARFLNAALFAVMFFSVTSCTSFHVTSGDIIVGRQGHYNYSPSVIQSGDVRMFWWCSDAPNPDKPSQISDTIQYESINIETKQTSGPITVLAETPGAWDSVFTCNPKVIGGVFSNPLGDGNTYRYAMYYVGTSSPAGVDNSIGVAFSNDGIHWNKYPDPVISSTSSVNYGVGQPALYNSDGKQTIWMFYEDYAPSVHHAEAISFDGIHFSTQGILTTNGLDPQNPQASWGDMAYDPQTEYWYAAYNLPTRNSSTTGNVIERGQYGFQVYRIPASSLLSGQTPWEQLVTIDTNLTGHESNFIPAFLRDAYGNLNVSPYPSIQIFTSMSYPTTSWKASPEDAGSFASPNYWDIGSAVWTPNSSPVVLNQYFNGTTHEATTGWIDPSGGFVVQYTLGHLYQSPELGASVPFYGCKRGATDYFVSANNGCSGEHVQGINGYGYPAPVPGMNLVAVYECKTTRDHYLSAEPSCKGSNAVGLIGYALP